MNLVVNINGRDAIPVRAIPWLTNWEAMTPDVLIQKLSIARDDVPKLQTYSLEPNGSVSDIPADQWASVSPDALPPSIFVWKVDFEGFFASAYGLRGASKSVAVAFDGDDLEDLRALGVGLDEMDVNVLEHQAAAIDPQVLDEYRESVAETAHELVRRVTDPLLEAKVDRERRMVLRYDVGILDPGIRTRIMEGFDDCVIDDAIREAMVNADATNNAGADQTFDCQLHFTMEDLIQAYGSFTGMDAGWFNKLEDRPKLLAARVRLGSGGKGGAKPLFCPYKVMQWLVTKPRRGNSRKEMTKDTGWRLLERHFPKVYGVYSIGDTRGDSAG